MGSLIATQRRRDKSLLSKKKGGEMSSYVMEFFRRVEHRVYIRSCFVCQRPVAVSDLESGIAGLSRIGGNSENGYELYHTACCSI